MKTVARDGVVVDVRANLNTVLLSEQTLSDIQSWIVEEPTDEQKAVAFKMDNIRESRIPIEHIIYHDLVWPKEPVMTKSGMAEDKDWPVINTYASPAQTSGDTQ